MVSKSNETPLTAAYANSLFTYNPETGHLLFRVITKWHKAGGHAGGIQRTRTNKYLQVWIHGRLYKVHRVIWLMVTGRWPSTQIDHIDGDGTNNKLNNLRDVTNRTNCQNQRQSRNNTTGTTGVYCSGSKWRVYIGVNGRDVYLGSFTNKDDAIAARQTASVEYGYHPNHGSDRPL